MSHFAGFWSRTWMKRYPAETIRKPPQVAMDNHVVLSIRDIGDSLEIGIQSAASFTRFRRILNAQRSCRLFAGPCLGPSMSPVRADYLVIWSANQKLAS